MEIALIIDDLAKYMGNDVHSYNWSWGSENNGIYQSIELIENIVGNNRISVLYYGNEFCEYRIPSVEQLTTFIGLCKKNMLKPVLVTPVVTDKGIDRIISLLEYMSVNNINIDVVINDFGVLELVRRKYPNHKVIMGRIMDKTSHDSRATVKELEDYYGLDGLKFAKTPGIISEQAKYVLRDYDVIRWEFDLPNVGIELPTDIDCSLYWPYCYLTTGRVCSMRAAHLNGKDKYLVGSSFCEQVCRNVMIEKRKPSNGYCLNGIQNKNEMYLFQKGNTVFYLYEGEKTDKQFEQFDRIVLQI